MGAETRNITKQASLKELRHLLPFLRPYWHYYVFGSVTLITSILLKVFIPRLLGGSVDSLRQLEGQADPGDLLSEITGSAVLIFAVAVAVAVVRTSSRLLLLGVCRRAVHDIRRALFDRLLRLSPSFYVRHQTGHLMSRCVNDMQNVQGLMGPVFMYLAETLALYLICLSFMLDLNLQLTLISLAPFPLFIFLAKRIAGRIQRGSRAAQEGLAEVSAKVDESLSGHLVIKSLALEEHDFERFVKRNDALRNLNLKVTWDRATLYPLMMVLGSCSTFLVLLVGGPQVVRDEISLGNLVTMIFYLQMMAAPTGALGFVISSLQRGTAAFVRVRELMEADVSIDHPTSPATHEIQNGGLEVRNLSVTFPPLRDQPHLSGTLTDEVLQRPDSRIARTVLDDINFQVPAGSTLGIVGPTGAGKTILLRAIARQLEIRPGTIFIDGADIIDLPLQEIRSKIGFVPQENFLFSRTLADNVALGNPQADTEAISRAIRAAQLEKDLNQLPDGINTIIGERGVNLSGGQRQRTALARVMLLQPRILILDDTLSAVDTHTADEILQELRPLMTGRTTLMVAHRIDSIRHAEQIIVLDAGRVVEQGRHQDLIEADGLYARLYEQQKLRESMQQEQDSLRAELNDPRHF